MNFNLWTMIVLVVLIGAIASTIQAFITRRPARTAAALEDGEAQRLRDEVRVLRERVAVLERIATDRNHALEHEFDKLRDS